MISMLFQPGGFVHKPCPPAFPPSQFLGSGFTPRNWEDGKAGGQGLCNKAQPGIETKSVESPQSYLKCHQLRRPWTSDHVANVTHARQILH